MNHTVDTSVDFNRSDEDLLLYEIADEQLESAALKMEGQAYSIVFHTNYSGCFGCPH